MSQCRSCGAEIIWTITANGRRMPLDADPAPPDPVDALHGLFVLGPAVAVTPNGTILDPAGEVPWGAKLTPILADPPAFYRSHFATCPNADQHRRPRS